MSLIQENARFQSSSCLSLPDAPESPVKALQEPCLGTCIDHASSAVSGSVQPPIRRFPNHSLAAAYFQIKALQESARNLKQDWLDSSHWRALAVAHGYKLPHWYLPLTPRGIESVLRDLKISRDDFRVYFGISTYSQFVKRNPTMPLWAFAGQCLEQLDLRP